MASTVPWMSNAALLAAADGVLAIISDVVGRLLAGLF
jgi:hypothetical protein